MNLYGNDEDFWTSNDEEKITDGESSDDESNSLTFRNDPTTLEGLAAVYQELIGGDTQGDAGGGVQHPTYAEGKGEIPIQAVAAPNKRAIRKSWVVHDTLPTGEFKEELPDPALE